MRQACHKTERNVPIVGNGARRDRLEEYSMDSRALALSFAVLRISIAAI
jgi:hypothetical protein